MPASRRGVWESLLWELWEPVPVEAAAAAAPPVAPSPKLGKTAFEEDSSAARRARRGVYSVVLVFASLELAAAWEEPPLEYEAAVPLARKACSARSR